MTKSFFCGQYLCRINGTSKLISLIPDRWKKYSQAQAFSSQRVTIHLEEDNLEYETAGNDGWFAGEKQGFPISVYSNHGKALFGLQQREPLTVTVYLRKAVESYLCIGVHYGMMLALHRECVGLHGVTILCGNEIIILSAPSGTGKTTLAKLLEKHCDGVVINGDFALLVPTENGVIFEPTPFCGSSGRSLNRRLRVNRVVFLGQAKENRWRGLDGREAMTRFMSNAFVPDWDKDVLQAVRENILKCASMLKVNAYGFAPTQEAAELFLKQIEEDSSLCSE